MKKFVTGTEFTISLEMKKMTKCLKQQFVRHWTQGSKGPWSLRDNK